MHYKRCQNADIRYTIHPIQLSCQIHLTVHIPEWSCKSETVESPADIVALLWHQIVQHLILRLHLMILESVLNKWLKLTVMIFASCSSWTSSNEHIASNILSKWALQTLHESPLERRDIAQSIRERSLYIRVRIQLKWKNDIVYFAWFYQVHILEANSHWHKRWRWVTNQILIILFEN